MSPGAATEGVTFIFPEKNWRSFLVITVSGVTLFIFS